MGDLPGGAEYFGAEDCGREYRGAGDGVVDRRDALRLDWLRLGLPAVADGPVARISAAAATRPRLVPATEHFGRRRILIRIMFLSRLAGSLLR